MMSPPMMYFDEMKYHAWSYNNDLAEVSTKHYQQCQDYLDTDVFAS